VGSDLVAFYFHYNSYSARLQHSSSKANIFYNFQPADHHPESKPLFVFFNGSPGKAISSNDFGLNLSGLSLRAGVSLRI
jgi:hypothetical protein